MLNTLVFAATDTVRYVMRSGPLVLTAPWRNDPDLRKRAFEVSKALGEVMDVYLSRCRPLLAEDPRGFLFPARKGGVKTPGTLAEQLKRTLWQETGIDLNAHAFRHLAALLFLRQFPGEYETTRLLLGHKDISTTTRYYCGLEQADALRRYDALIDRYREKEPT
jgi:integrase